VSDTFDKRRGVADVGVPDSETGIVPRGIEEFGPYLVYERLGQGGMATVHRAEKRGVGIRRPIALKRLLSHVAVDPDLVKLFVDEARLASHLRHANVAQTYELGKVDDTFFIAMEYASGPTLTQIIRQCQNAELEIPLTITVNVLAQVCEALDYAHNLCDESGQPLRIIHRDVSPANIIVTNAGIVKLIDFGIAKATISSVKTQTGFIKGKFGYIAPEYISGKIDARVDLFAVGVVAHEMLSGRRLFEGQDDFETLANIREMKMQPPSRWNAHVTPELDDIVMTALERDPDKRWQSAAAMQVALANAGREFGLVVGSQQLVEWVEWAFSQIPRDPGPARRAETNSGETDAIGRRAAARRRRDSSVLIELSHAPADLAEVVASRASRRALSPSESDETAPLEQFMDAFHNSDVLTPPARSAPPSPPRRPHDSAPPPIPPPRTALPPDGGVPTPPPLPPPPPPPRSRPHESVPPPIPPPRTAAATEAADPQSLPPRPRTREASAPPPLPRPRTREASAPPPRITADPGVPAVPPSREIEVIVVPPGTMFDMPDAEPTKPARPEPKPKLKRKPGASKKAKAPAELKQAAKPDPKQAAKPGSKQAARPDPKQAARPDPKQAARPDPKQAARPDPRQAASPDPRQAASPDPRQAASPKQRAAAPDAQPRKRRTMLWLILLMIALGAGAMAAAYYWPVDL
jgi:serine/threonine protein kinase